MAPGVGGGNVVERLLVELGVDANQLLSGVDKATGQAAQNVEQMGSRSSAVMSKIAAAAAIAGGAIMAIFSVKTVASAISYTDEYAASVRKLARETGLTVEQTQEMMFAGKHVNVQVDTLSASLGVLAKKLKGVQDEETGVTTGGKSTAQILADIGIQATDATGNLRPMGDLIPEISDVFAHMPDGIEKTGLAMQLFGRGGKDMIPFLNLGSAAMADLAVQANKLGLVLSADNIDKVKQYSQAQRTLGEAVGGLKLLLGIAIIPTLTKFFNMLIAAQPAIREKFGKAIKWLSTVFQALAIYIRYVIKTGDPLHAFLTNANTPLAILFAILGETIVNLRTIAEWFLTAAEAAGEWGSKIIGMLDSGRSAADNFGVLANIVPIVAGAITALITAMVVSTVLAFVGQIASLAFSIVTFPLELLGEIVGAVANFVSTAAGMVSKAVTITQNVVSTGAEIIRSLPWVYGEVKQLVIRTGAKIIDKLNPITGTVTQSVEITPPADAGEGAKGWFAALMANILGGLGGSPEVLKAIGLFASGVIAGIGAAVRGKIAIGVIARAIGSAIAAAATAVAAVVGLPVWAVVAIVIATIVVAALAFAFRDKIAAFFTGPFPRFFTEALPAFAKSLPGWAGQVAGMAAGALIFALLGIPALLITRLAPAIGEGIVGIFQKIPWGRIGGGILSAMKGVGGAVVGAIVGAFGKVPWGDIGVGIVNFAKSIPGWFVDALKAIPGLFVNALKAIPGILADAAGAIQDFAKSIPGWIADALAAIPGILADLPGWFADALGAIPGIAMAALTGAAGLVGIVGGALGDVIGAILATPVAQAVGDLMGQLWSGFQTGWNRINTLTNGALNDLVGGVLGLPGRLAGLVGTLFGAASDLGGAIFDGIMSGLRAVPEALGDLAGALKDVFKGAINAGIAALNAAIPNSIPLKIKGIGYDIPLPDNPIPRLDFAGGGIVPGPIGAPVPIMAHGGEEILRAGERQAPQFNFAWAFSGYDWEAIRRAMHAEADRALNEAMGQAERRTYLAGAPLSPYVG